MSTLQQVPRITGGEIYLTAAGRRIAAVGSCEIQARREGVPLIPFGALEGAAAELGPMQYTIALTRLSPEDGEIDLFSLNSFSLVVKKQAKQSPTKAASGSLLSRRSLPATMRWKSDLARAVTAHKLKGCIKSWKNLFPRSCKRSCRQAVKRCSGSYPAP